MQLSEIHIHNFRNHHNVKFTFSDRITVFTGANGAGKTSLLEAISVLGSARSFRGGKLLDLIKRGTNTSVVEGFVTAGSFQNSIRAEISARKRMMLLNGKKLRQARELMAVMPFVIFSPADHRIVEGDASDRRVFLNKAVSLWNFSYADLLKDFHRILLQRNRILKENRGNLGGIRRIESSLSPWDKQFIHIAKQILETRIEYLRAFTPLFENQYQGLAKNRAPAGLSYIETLAAHAEKVIDNKEELMKEQLQATLKEDILRGSTSIGPHKDDISLTIDGNQAKFYGSQGEKRTVALALRLAEVELIRVKHRVAPMLLVDDVSSELDLSRRHALVELLRNGDSQVLITATELPVDLLEGIDHPFDHYDLSRSEEN